MGQYHVNVLTSLQNKVDSIVIYDQDASRRKFIADRFSVNEASSMEDLFSLCDACILAAPTTLHHQLGMEILRADKHLLVEKPIAEKIEEAEELIDTAFKRNLVFQVGHVERFNGAVIELQNTVEEPYLWESRRLGPPNTRITDVGVCMDMLIHDIDIALRTIKDEIVEINASGKKIVNNHEDVVCASLHFEKGCIANFIASRVTHQKVRTLFISQKDSYLHLDFTTQDLQIYRESNTDTTTLSEKIRYRHKSFMERLFIHKENPLKLEQTHFIDKIVASDTSANTNVMDLQTLRVTQSILKKIDETSKKHF